MNYDVVQMLSFYFIQRLVFQGPKVEKVARQSQAKETITRNKHQCLNPGEPSYQSWFNWMRNWRAKIAVNKVSGGKLLTKITLNLWYSQAGVGWEINHEPSTYSFRAILKGHEETDSSEQSRLTSIDVFISTWDVWTPVGIYLDDQIQSVTSYSGAS